MSKTLPKSSIPAELGYHMPAEWERHQATWIGWPHNTSDWPGKFMAIQWVYGEIVRKIAAGEIVNIIVESRAHQQRAQRILTQVGVDPSRLRFHIIKTNRGWTRDFGPMFVVNKESADGLAIVDFGFNAWARYRDWQKDTRVPAKVAKKMSLPIIKALIDSRPFVLEGGSIEVNGHGTLMTTEECLLDQQTQVRNPGLDRQGTEKMLRDYLGVTNILWLKRGIAGDDTHGHIDDICRFVNRSTVVLCQEQNRQDRNYLPLQENREMLQDMRLENGRKIEVVHLPMPSPLFFRDQRLPASYANFYICNAAVLVPTFNDPNDRLALGILAELIDDRPVIGIHAVDLVWGLGTLHCLTQQQPIDHSGADASD